MNHINKIDDADLTRRVKSGEKEAYQILFERYAPKIYHFALSYLKSTADSEELVQDVFLKVWEKRDILDATQNIKAFIFKIAINTIYDFIRRKNIETAFQEFSKANYSTGSNNTWDTVIFEEMQTTINRLVAQMPEQRRKIFKLSKSKGLTNDEIAKELQLSKRTVENQLYRALVFLKEHLQKDSVFALLFFYLFYS
ncbi:RNA polymerase sigma-70 factor [Prolixibacteraceae bacterium Z1-6]|uniref:RNA polymerase sigma factor n=1 Tax=Draconibacterium aestuarii TaxID=2998507 RepID=A0A9X3F6X1_9BACT|nr:RNA polymerase sigma-70 factor [Prolixibacteraceae bacterium Z1-6]